MTENKNETVKKAMISQPMAGKTDEEIAATRDLAVAKLRQMGYEVVNTLFTDEWKPPAHRCEDCAHHEHDAVPIARFDMDGNEVGSTTGTRCYCNHGGKHFVTGDNNHCDYWEEQ